MTASILGDVAVYLGGFVALVLGLLGYGALKDRRGHQRAISEALEDQKKREGRGRNAVAKEISDTKGADSSEFVDRMRSRDGDWRGL